jgi:hypothetical protein
MVARGPVSWARSTAQGCRDRKWINATR